MKAPTQLRTERGHLQDMKLSVVNSTSRQGIVSSLLFTKAENLTSSNLKSLSGIRSILPCRRRIEQNFCHWHSIETYRYHSDSLQALQSSAPVQLHIHKIPPYRQVQSLPLTHPKYLTYPFFKQLAQMYTVSQGGK